MSAPHGHRAVIVAAVAAILKQQIPEVAERVFRARTWALQEHEHPALLVYAWQEEKTRRSQDNRQYLVSLTLAVEARVADSSRNGEEVERDLEALTNAVCEAILQSREMLAGGGLVEHIESVKTTLGVNTKDSELALGRGLVAFDLRYSEQFDLRSGTIECDEVTLAWFPTLAQLSP